MIRRITITIDEQLDSAIRNIQAKKISENNKSVSFSEVVSQILKKGLMGFI